MHVSSQTRVAYHLRAVEGHACVLPCSGGLSTERGGGHDEVGVNCITGQLLNTRNTYLDNGLKSECCVIVNEKPDLT